MVSVSVQLLCQHIFQCGPRPQHHVTRLLPYNSEGLLLHQRTLFYCAAHLYEEPHSQFLNRKKSSTSLGVESQAWKYLQKLIWWHFKLLALFTSTVSEFAGLCSTPQSLQPVSSTILNLFRLLLNLQCSWEIQPTALAYFTEIKIISGKTSEIIWQGCLLVD